VAAVCAPINHTAFAFGSAGAFHAWYAVVEIDSLTTLMKYCIILSCLVYRPLPYSEAMPENSDGDAVMQ
jgi:hypothetical protein